MDGIMPRKWIGDPKKYARSWHMSDLTADTDDGQVICDFLGLRFDPY